MRISVSGGSYEERCVWPGVEEDFGSGGRAALALAQAEVKVHWYYYCPESKWENLKLIIPNNRICHHPEKSPTKIAFRYFHPLSKPTYMPRELPELNDISVKDQVVLRFGMMEGTARVEAKKCVYDPQSPISPVPFQDNGSTADTLAIVLNSDEALKYGNAGSENEAAANLFKREGASVVLVKAGSDGCRVYVNAIHTASVPPYWAEKIYKIGSGDVFSAAFAFHWGLKGQNPEVAADNASRCVAQYCETRTPSVVVGEKEQILQPVKQEKAGQVYIAGPLFTMAELWLIEEAFAALQELGVRPFSPYHEVGFGKPNEIVRKDLEGLRNSTAVFAIVDGCDAGTLFEIGYATKMGIPVVALSQNPKEADINNVERFKKLSGHRRLCDGDV